MYGISNGCNFNKLKTNVLTVLLESVDLFILRDDKSKYFGVATNALLFYIMLYSILSIAIVVN